ncbi:MAG: carbon-nitrogen hydrolase family protein [Myxococcota bacterium]
MRFAAAQVPDICDDVPAAIRVMHRLGVEAGRQGARLVCFPEAFLQGYRVEDEYICRVAIDLDSPRFDRILAALEEIVPVVVFGLFEVSAGRYYITAAVIARGVLVGRYRKHHLIGREQEIFTAGDVDPIFEIDGFSFAINICYDMQFPERAATPAALGAKLLVCPANNMLRRAAAERWKHRHNEIRRAHARGRGLVVERGCLW